MSQIEEARAKKLEEQRIKREEVAAKKAADKIERDRVAAEKRAEAEKNKVVMPEQNGVRRPAPGGKCAAAWDLFDKVSRAKGAPASIAEALRDGDAASQNVANMKAEYARWRKFHGVVGRVEDPDKSAKKEAEAKTKADAKAAKAAEKAAAAKKAADEKTAKAAAAKAEAEKLAAAKAAEAAAAGAKA